MLVEPPRGVKSPGALTPSVRHPGTCRSAHSMGLPHQPSPPATQDIERTKYLLGRKGALRSALMYYVASFENQTRRPDPLLTTCGAQGQGLACAKSIKDQAFLRKECLLVLDPIRLNIYSYAGVLRRPSLFPPSCCTDKMTMPFFPACSR